MHPLPIKVPPANDEGGHGLVLRALSRNGLTFSRAASWLNIPWGKTMRSTDCKLWSWAVQVDAAWLEHKLPSNQRAHGPATYGFMGHLWQGAHCFRIQHPQVCARCIHQNGYCRESWDVMGVCVCGEHRQVLTDTCQRCGAILDWNRPAVDTCTCRRHLSSSGHVDIIDDALLKWTVWLEARLALSESYAKDPALPGLPAELSIDGVYKLILAFGLKAHDNQVLPATIWRNNMPPATMAAALTRGIKRLTQALESRAWSDWFALVHDQTLERLEVQGVCHADRDLARRLRREVFSLEQDGDPVLRYRRRGQLELFPGDAT